MWSISIAALLESALLLCKTDAIESVFFLFLVFCPTKELYNEILLWVSSTIPNRRMQWISETNKTNCCDISFVSRCKNSTLSMPVTKLKMPNTYLSVDFAQQFSLWHSQTKSKKNRNARLNGEKRKKLTHTYFALGISLQFHWNRTVGNTFYSSLQIGTLCIIIWTH